MRLVLLGAVWALTACASAPAPLANSTVPPEGAITYLPPLVEITLVTASGLREPQSEQTETARLNLADALASAVPAEALDSGDLSRARAEALAQKLDIQSDPQTPARETPAELIALIRVEYDLESSASRLVQGGLGLMFGGVPGPDGIDQTAQIALFDRATSDLVWSHTAAAYDPRDPEAAKRLINKLIAASDPDTAL